MTRDSLAEIRAGSESQVGFSLVYSVFFVPIHRMIDPEREREIKLLDSKRTHTACDR